MTPSLFTTDSDPTSILPTLESLIHPNGSHSSSVSESGSETSETSYGSSSEYIAPLSGKLALLATPSIDGTTIGTEGIRPENLVDVTEEDKAVSALLGAEPLSQRVQSTAFAGTGTHLRRSLREPYGKRK